MKSIHAIIKQKEQYYKDREHLFPNWRFMFRIWRKTYLELMDSNGYSISVANYYLQLIETRRKQSERFRLEKQARERQLELLGLNSGNRAKIFVNERTQIVTFANGEQYSYEALEYHPELIQMVRQYCIVEMTI